MGADLHIHVLTDDFTENDYAVMNRNTFGSRFFAPRPGGPPIEIYSRCNDTPNVWVGGVSWLKAGLCDDADDAASFVPDAVAQIHEAVGEHFPVIDDALIGRIREALAAENATEYGLGKPDAVLAFVEEHRGARAFTVSW